MPEIPCYTCGGSGEYPVGTTCPTCGGDGDVTAVGTHSIAQAYAQEINSKVAALALNVNVFHSYQIIEALDTDEYDALTDTQKDGVKVLLSCGRVDLNEGKAGRVRLWNWFGAESTTVANLTELLS